MQVDSVRMCILTMKYNIIYRTQRSSQCNTVSVTRYYYMLDYL